MLKKNWIILGLIFIFSFSLFTIYSFYVFPTPNWDEVSFAYNAFSILKTGRDEWGRWFPLIFRAFGDYKLPLYAYLSILPIAIFGLKILAIRLVSILAGASLAIIIFFISRQLKLSTQKSLFISLVSTLNPWHLWLSSTALESNLGLTLFSLAILFMIKFIQKPKSQKSLLLTILLLGLTLHTYNSYRLISPLISTVIFLFAFLKRKQLRNKKALYLSVLVFLIFFLPVVRQTLLGYGRARFNTVSLFHDQGIKLAVEADRNFPHSLFLGRLFHNKIVYTLQALMNNYLLNFSPEFLFLKGGNNLAFSPPSYGYFYWWELFLVVAGFILLMKGIKKGKPIFLFIFFLLLSAPLPAIVTRDGAHSLRSYNLFISLLFLLTLTIKQLKKKAHLVLLIFLYIASFFLFNEYTLNHYLKHFDSHWLSAENQAIRYAVAKENKYNLIAVPKDSIDEAYIFYLFYSKTKPQEFWRLAKRRFANDWYWVDRVGKFVFPENTDTEIYKTNSKVLLLTRKPIYTKHQTLAVFSSQDGQVTIKAITFPNEKK